MINSYAADATQQTKSPYKSAVVAVNLQSLHFVAYRCHYPQDITDLEKLAIYLAALQEPKATVIYTDSRSSAEALIRLREGRKKGNYLLNSINDLLLREAEVTFIPREKNWLADAIAQYSWQNDFTGYGLCDKSGRVLTTKAATEAEIFNSKGARRSLPKIHRLY